MDREAHCGILSALSESYSWVGGGWCLPSWLDGGALARSSHVSSAVDAKCQRSAHHHRYAAEEDDERPRRLFVAMLGCHWGTVFATPAAAELSFPRKLSLSRSCLFCLLHCASASPNLLNVNNKTLCDVPAN